MITLQSLMEGTPTPHNTLNSPNPLHPLRILPQIHLTSSSVANRNPSFHHQLSPKPRNQTPPSPPPSACTSPRSPSSRSITFPIHQPLSLRDSSVSTPTLTAARKIGWGRYSHFRNQNGGIRGSGGVPPSAVFEGIRGALIPGDRVDF